MEVYGRTRFGNLIYIDFAFDQFGKRYDVYPKYDHTVENFDAWVVFGFVAVRFLRSDEEEFRFQRTERAENHFFKLWSAKSDEIPSVEMILSHRMQLAKRLVQMEFQT